MATPVKGSLCASFNLHDNPSGQCYFHLHFTDDETSLRVSNSGMNGEDTLVTPGMCKMDLAGGKAAMEHNKTPNHSKC